MWEIYFLEFIEEGFSYTESSGFMIWLNEDDCSFIIQPVNFDVDSIVFDMCYHYSFRIMDVNFLRKIKHNIVKINNINALPFSMKTKKTNGILDLSLSRQNYFSGNAKNENLRGLITFFNESSWVNNKRATYRYTLNFKKPSGAIKNWVFKIFAINCLMLNCISKKNISLKSMILFFIRMSLQMKRLNPLLKYFKAF